MAPTDAPDGGAVVDVVMPARNEAATVADNVRASLGCRHVRTVIVVDDGSSDGTADVAAAAGAHVIRRDVAAGSKAHAMRAGVEASDATHILFADADCTDLTAGHLEEVCAPVLEGRADMSLGAFDYGWWNAVVVRAPSLSGERIVPRWLWDLIPDDKLDGYTIETRLNEVVAANGLRTSARTMVGVSHRTKRDKFGWLEGMRRSWRMAVDIAAQVRPFGDIRLRAYRSYRRGLTVEAPARPATRPRPDAWR